MSYRRIDRLPGIEELERRTRALATLDAILSAEWELRYYSFNRRWAPGERMASMRDGCGDEWFLVFTEAGAFLKGFDHESAVRQAIDGASLEGIPPTLIEQAREPAFNPDYTSYLAWCERDGVWRHWAVEIPPGDDPDGSDEHLSILDGDPSTYRAFAKDYFEKELALDAIAAVYAGAPITAALLERLQCERSVDQLAEDLDEIGYGERPPWR